MQLIPSRWRGVLAAVLIAPVAAQAGAQSIRVLPFPSLGGVSVDEARARGLRDTVGAEQLLLRSASRSLAAGTTSGAAQVMILMPELRVISNSALPNWSNDGALRAGRGANTMLSAGAAIQVGVLHLVVAPELVAEQNLAYQVIPYPQGTSPARSPWANPFHPLPESVDLPLRFGDESHRRLTFGQSSLTVDLGPLAAGASTENRWWGPGLRNAIVLSNNAAGFAHGFLRPAQPFTTRAGVFDFDALAGQLHESEYFDTDPSNDTRSIAALAFTWRPTGPPGIQLGASRLRIAGSGGHDQVTSLFGRWVIPGAGFETYGEWARFQDPKSLRDFLELPNHTQGYTLGLQWQRPLTASRFMRLGAESSYLEPSTTFRIRPVTTSYTSASVPQGFTNRGELLGASIGPGSSSQWLGGDVFAPAWSAGGSLGRTRYDNGTLFGPLVPELRRQDVTLFASARASLRLHGVQVAAEFTDGLRMNYLFQGFIDDPILGTSKGVDIRNRTLAVTVTTGAGK